MTIARYTYTHARTHTVQDVLQALLESSGNEDDALAALRQKAGGSSKPEFAYAPAPLPVGVLVSASAPPQGGGAKSIAQQLAELKEAKEKGFVTEAEYAAARATTLGLPQPPPPAEMNRQPMATSAGGGAHVVPAQAAAGCYVGCGIFPLPIVACMSPNGPDELRECCFIFPTPLGMNQVWRREGQTNTFYEVGGEQRKHVSAGSHNETPTPYCAAKVC